MQDDVRSAKWDNLKFILIFLVVLGHILFPFRNESQGVKGLYFFIYLFHMPLFIFVSGLFSKKIIRKRQWNRVASYLALYLFIRILDTLGTFIEKGKLRLNFFRTNGPDWYAMAIFVFLVITIIFQECKSPLLMSAAIFVGLIAGYNNNLGNLFASMRVCVFYPFFLMGFYADRRRIEEYNKPVIYVPAVILLAALSVFFILKGSQFFPFINLLKGKASYDQMKLTGYEGMLFRGIQYVFSLIVSILMILSVPSAKNIFSGIGANTLPVYAWHNLFLKMFWASSGKKRVLSLFPKTYMLILILLCLFLIILCSSHLFEKTRKIF